MIVGVFPATISENGAIKGSSRAHSHIHSLAPCGVFLESGKFIGIKRIPAECFLKKWEENVFDFLLKEEKITQEIIYNMESWKHYGFSVDNSVYVAKDDKPGMGRLIEYISRCPFSLSRLIKITQSGKVLYRAVKSACRAFPILGNEKLKAGVKCNFEIFGPLDFIAEVTCLPPGRHRTSLIKVSIRSGIMAWYSNKQRGIRNKEAERGELPQNQKLKKECSLTWALD